MASVHTSGQLITVPGVNRKCLNGFWTEHSLLLFHLILFFLVHVDGELCMIVSVVAIQLAIDQYLLRLAEFVCALSWLVTS